MAKHCAGGVSCSFYMSYRDWGISTVRLGTARFSPMQTGVYVIPTWGGNLRTRWSYHRFSLHSPVHEMRWYNLPSLALQTLLLRIRDAAAGL